MRCPNCGNETAAGAFCTQCGVPLPASLTPRDELDEIKAALAALTRRVERLDARLAAGHTPTPPRVPAPVATVPGESVAAGDQPLAAHTPGSPPSGAPRVAYAAAGAGGVGAGAGGAGGGGAAPPANEGRGRSIDWEELLGRNWFAIIGSVALAVGIGFFLKLAFDNQWIGETGRVLLGVAAGAVLIGLGEWMQRKYPAWAQPVTGGGLAVLYLAIYAAFAFYSLIPPLAAFGLLALVAAFGGLLAVRYEAIVIALLGVGGAFLTPILLGTSLRGEERLVLLAYLLVVNAGVVLIAALRPWRWLTLIALVMTYGLLAFWLDELTSFSLLVAQGALTLLFLLFVGATTLFHILWRRAPGGYDMALMTLNAAAYYGMTFGILWSRFESWFGFITLGLAAFYTLVGYAALRRSSAPPQVALFSVATALIFLTIAVPLQLSGQWVTVAWATEAAILLWVGFALRNWKMRAFAHLVMAVAVLRLLVLDTQAIGPGVLTPVINARFLTFAVAIAAVYAAAWLYRGNRGKRESWEESFPLLFVALANFLTLWILSAEVIAFFDTRAGVPGVMTWSEAETGRMLSLTAVWAVYSVWLLGIALASGAPWLRWAALFVIGAALVKLLLVDTFAVAFRPESFLVLLNPLFATSLLVFGVLAMMFVLLMKRRDEMGAEERWVFTALAVGINLVAIWALSVQAVNYFEYQSGLVGIARTSAMHLSLTVLWAVYAMGLIVTGIVRRSRGLRLSGIAVLAVPVAKLFVFDVFLLDQGYRVAAFVTLGVLLLALGLAYQRYNQAFKGFFFGKAA